jgi:hypothetical protein
VELWKGDQRAVQLEEGRTAERERAWSLMTVPDTKPQYGRATAGSDGRIWVTQAEESRDHTALRVFDEAGYFTGTVVIPGRFTVLDSGPGWVAGVARDDSDVEFVQMWELLPR